MNRRKDPKSACLRTDPRAFEFYVMCSDTELYLREVGKKEEKKKGIREEQKGMQACLSTTSQK